MPELELATIGVRTGLRFGVSNKEEVATFAGEREVLLKEEEEEVEAPV